MTEEEERAILATRVDAICAKLRTDRKYVKTSRDIALDKACDLYKEGVYWDAIKAETGLYGAIITAEIKTRGIPLRRPKKRY